MVRRANKGGSVFSWADEVEKEEEEEEAAAAAASGRAQPQQRKKKPNPFGSARPREVVLQDKGIDWRQLDLHLQQHSPLLISRNGFHQNEKLQKQSNPQLVTVNSCPQVTSSPRIQSPILCAPPLRYPPKYVAGILYEHWVSMAPNVSRYEHLKIEKGNGAPGGKHKSAMRRRTMNGYVEVREGKENFHGGNSLGLPLVNQNIGTPEIHGKRMSLSATRIGMMQPTITTDIRVDSGMDRNDEATKQKWHKVTKKSMKQVKNGFHQKTNSAKKGIKLHS